MRVNKMLYPLRAFGACCLALAALLLTPAVAWADVASEDVDLVCDEAKNLAVLRFSTSRQAATVPRVPAALDHGLADSYAPSLTECTLADGTTIRVRGGVEQAFGYGEGGANPPAFFSLWINQRKVISREVWKPGYEKTITNPAIYDGALVTAKRITICATAEGKRQRCSSRPLNLAKAPIDRAEYPSSPRQPPVGHISVIAQGASNQRFCTDYLSRIKPELKDALNGRQTSLSIDDETFTEPTRLEHGSMRSGVVNLLPGDTRRLFIWESDTHYFDGTVIAIAPPGMTSREIVAAYPIDDIDSWPGRQAPPGVTLISGGQKQLYPGVALTYVHLLPQMIDGALYLFAYPTNNKMRPTAALVKPLAGGGFVTLCAFNRTEPHY